MKNWICSLLVLFIGLCITSICDAKVQAHRIYRVVRVVDGDTFKLNTGDYVRLLGIDAPEKENNAKLQRDIEKRNISKSAELAMGRKAYSFTNYLIAGKKVRLAFDNVRYDEYNRVLAYVYLTNGVFVNAKIIESGYAYPYSFKENSKYTKLFNKLYAEAREKRRGLWHKSGQKSFKWFSN